MLQSPPLDRVPGAILLVAAAICVHGAATSGSDGWLLWPAALAGCTGFQAGTGSMFVDDWLPLIDNR